MRLILILVILLILILAGGWYLFFRPIKAQVHEGDTVPDMAFPADDGGTIRTTDLKGKWAVLYFYPKDDTPGCTAEAKAFTAMLDDYRDAGAVVYGINTDSRESHLKFKEKHSIKVTLLTDVDQTASKAFGIRVVAGLCSRDSVLINPQGRVEKIYRGVNPAGSPAEILTYILSKK
jgi:peroxiredoxin Q/BCP